MNPIQELSLKINELQLWSKKISLKRGEFLCKQGCIDTNLYAIESGALKVFIINEENEQIIRFGYQNNFISALDSFISDKPTQFYIQAIKKTDINVITRETYLGFINSTDALKTLWNKLNQAFILQQLEREIDLLTSSPKLRYERVLDRSPQLFQEIPHKHIASYLRMTPETLSRLKKS